MKLLGHINQSKLIIQFLLFWPFKKSDFLIFSMVPILLMGYFEFRSGFDREWNSIFVAYIVLNSVANALSFIPYSDRIYSFSWLLIPIIITVLYRHLPYLIKVSYIFMSISIFYFYNSFWLGL